MVIQCINVVYVYTDRSRDTLSDRYIFDIHYISFSKSSSTDTAPCICTSTVVIWLTSCCFCTKDLLRLSNSALSSANFFSIASFMILHERKPRALCPRRKRIFLDSALSQKLNWIQTSSLLGLSSRNRTSRKSVAQKDESVL